MVRVRGSELRSRSPGEEPLELEPGELIAGRFRVQRLAGRGGMGAVFRAEDLTTGRPVALKVMAGRNACSSADTARFLREAELLRGLSHPAIVRYVAHGQLAHGAPFLAMEWVEGVDLATHLGRTGLRVEEALTLLERLASALASAHRAGVIHRDIKPSNLMLAGAEVAQCKVLDFGIARSLSASRTLTRASGVLGSVGYMAPEQALGELEVDARADVFALGCLFYECLTGSAAFSARHDVGVLVKVLHHEPPRISTLRPELGQALDELVSSMLEKDRGRRPADAGVVLRALHRLPRLEGPAARKEPRSEPVAAAQEAFATVVLCASRLPAPDTLRLSLYAEPTADDDLTVLSARFGARPLPLHHGAYLFVWLPERSCSLIDQARQAARFARAVCEARPDLSVVVTTGGVDLSDDIPTGAAIRRASELLEATRDALTMDSLTAAYVKPILSEHCVGRDKELAWLEATFAECLSEQAAALVLLTAPAHVGKTRLVEAFVEPLRQAGRAEVRTVHAQPRGPNLVATLLGSVPPTELASWLRARCDERPLILVLEDLHWCDRASLDALERAVTACTDCPLLVLAVGRCDVAELGPWRRLSAQRLSLRPLTTRQLERLASLTVGHAAQLSVAALERVARLADGDVFVLLELARALSCLALELPESALAWVQARLEAFAPDLRRMLRAASLFGEVCSLEHVQSALGDDVDAAACLRALIEEEVLTLVDETHVAFRHELLREAAHGLLGAPDLSAVYF